MTTWFKSICTTLVAACVVVTLSAAGPAYVDMTWMSIANMYFEVGPVGILADGYFSRIPQSEFYGGGGGLAKTKTPYKPDVATIKQVMTAIGGPSKIKVLLTGHSHFDHSFDTGTWSNLTGAAIYGSKTTCLQAMADKVPAERCTAVNGREKIVLADGVTMYVVRLNHSGDPEKNPEQHNAVELDAVPVKDPATGGLRLGVAEDFPNGGGTRGFLFTVDGPQGRYSWFYEDSMSPVDIQVPIVINGVNYGAPLDNLKAAMKDAGLDSVDLWLGTGGIDIARLVLPVVKAKAYLPQHWDGLYGAFKAGIPNPYADPALEEFLAKSGVKLFKPGQYMDKWRLDRQGLRPMPNTPIKQALGFADVQSFAK